MNYLKKKKLQISTNLYNCHFHSLIDTLLSKKNNSSWKCKHMALIKAFFVHYYSHSQLWVWFPQSCRHLKHFPQESFHLTLIFNMPNFLNEIIHLTYFEMSIIIKMRTLYWSDNSIQPIQAARMCRVTWLCTGGKGWWHSVLAG